MLLDLRHVLAMRKQGGGMPEMLVQVASPNLAPLPADVRKWPDAVSEVQSMSELLHRKEESVDVLATRLLLWDNLMSADQRTDTDALLQQMHDLLSPHGVWYMSDLLPVESPRIGRTPTFLERGRGCANARWT